MAIRQLFAGGQAGHPTSFRRPWSCPSFYSCSRVRFPWDRSFGFPGQSLPTQPSTEHARRLLLPLLRRTPHLPYRGGILSAPAYLPGREAHHQVLSRRLSCDGERHRRLLFRKRNHIGFGVCCFTLFTRSTVKPVGIGRSQNRSALRTGKSSARHLVAPQTGPSTLHAPIRWIGIGGGGGESRSPSEIPDAIRVVNEPFRRFGNLLFSKATW